MPSVGPSCRVSLFACFLPAIASIGNTADSAEPTAFGNEAGCARLIARQTGEWSDVIGDASVSVTSELIEWWESACDLPDTPDLTGNPMNLTCAGEGSVWEEHIALREVFGGMVLITEGKRSDGSTLDPNARFLPRCEQQQAPHTPRPRPQPD